MHDFNKRLGHVQSGYEVCAQDAREYQLDLDFLKMELIGDEFWVYG